MVVTALVARRVNRVSVVDVTWGLALLAAAVVCAVVGPLVADADAWRSWLLAALVAVWSGRLSWHILKRSRGHGEDPRYAEDARRRAERRPLRRRRTPGVRRPGCRGVAGLVAAPGGRRRRRPVDVAGVGRRGASGRSAWSSSRSATPSSRRTGPSHATSGPRSSTPGCGATRGTRTTSATPACGGASGSPAAFASGWLPATATLVAPVAMTYFLAFATGARLLEQTMMQRPGYPAYAARTSMFVPWPPRR